MLYILTDYKVLDIVYLDQLSGASHTHISYHDIVPNLILTEALVECLGSKLREVVGKH